MCFVWFDACWCYFVLGWFVPVRYAPFCFVCVVLWCVRLILILFECDIALTLGLALASVC